MEKITAELRKFIEQNRVSNQWIEGDGLRVYIRKGIHSITPGTEPIETLDIANAHSRIRGRGAFTKFLDEVERTSKRPVYAESVQNKRLRRFLVRRGYEHVPGSGTRAPCFILFPPHEDF